MERFFLQIIVFNTMRKVLLSSTSGDELGVLVLCGRGRLQIERFLFAIQLIRQLGP